MKGTNFNAFRYAVLSHPSLPLSLSQPQSRTPAIWALAAGPETKFHRHTCHWYNCDSVCLNLKAVYKRRNDTMHVGVTGERNLNEINTSMNFCNSKAQHLEFIDGTETYIAVHNNICHRSSNPIALLSSRICFIVFWRFDMWQTMPVIGNKLCSKCQHIYSHLTSYGWIPCHHRDKSTCCKLGNLLWVEYTDLSASHIRPPSHYESAVCSISLQGLSRFIVLAGTVASGVLVECRLHFPVWGWEGGFCSDRDWGMLQVILLLLHLLA